MMKKEKFNRLATDNSQLQQFGEEFFNGTLLEFLPGFGDIGELSTDVPEYWHNAVIVNGKYENLPTVDPSSIFLKVKSGEVDNFNGLIIYTSTMAFWIIPAYQLQFNKTYTCGEVAYEKRHVNIEKDIAVGYDEEREEYIYTHMKIDADVVIFNSEAHPVGDDYGLCSGIRCQPSNEQIISGFHLEVKEEEGE